jgi:hypothetical protein
MAREQVMSDQQVTGTPCNLTPTNLEAAFWRIGSVSTGEYKNTSTPLQCNKAEKVK